MIEIVTIAMTPTIKYIYYHPYDTRLGIVHRINVHDQSLNSRRGHELLQTILIR